MNVGSAGGRCGPDPLEGPSKASPLTPAKDTGTTNKVEPSAHGPLVSKALSLPQIRSERVEEVRRLVEAGEIDTDARLESALEKFLQENDDL